MLSLAWLFRTAPCRGAAEYTENAALRQAFCEDFFDFFGGFFASCWIFNQFCCTLSFLEPWRMGQGAVKRRLEGANKLIVGQNEGLLGVNPLSVASLVVSEPE